MVARTPYSTRGPVWFDVGSCYRFIPSAYKKMDELISNLPQCGASGF